LDIPAPDSRQKTTPKDGRGKFPGSSSRIPKEDPFRAAIENLEDAQERYFEQEEVVRKISGLVAEPNLGRLAEAVANSISDPVEVRKLQSENDWLRKVNDEIQKEVGILKTRLQKKEEELGSSKNQCMEVVMAVN
jgi:hypothetical protein